MLTKLKFLPATAVALCSIAAFSQNAALRGWAPEYTNDAQLKFPDRYREWVYLSSGFDMSYKASMQMDHHIFDNVFANPEAYSAFIETGAWPDKTVLVLESRAASGTGSINRKGNYKG